MLAYVGLGSNLEHPRRQLGKALARLDALDGVRVLRVSPFYETAPVGGVPQPDYVNAVALVATSLAPHALLARMQAIERRQHRRRDGNTVRNAPRTLDLDLLLYGALRMRTSSKHAWNMEHWQYDTFRVNWDAEWRGSGMATFSLGVDGKPSEVRLNGGVFKRKP